MNHHESGSIHETQSYSQMLSAIFRHRNKTSMFTWGATTKIQLSAVKSPKIHSFCPYKTVPLICNCSTLNPSKSMFSGADCEQLTLIQSPLAMGPWGWCTECEHRLWSRSHLHRVFRNISIDDLKGISIDDLKGTEWTIPVHILQHILNLKIFGSYSYSILQYLFSRHQKWLGLSALERYNRDCNWPNSTSSWPHGCFLIGMLSNPTQLIVDSETTRDPLTYPYHHCNHMYMYIYIWSVLIVSIAYPFTVLSPVFDHSVIIAKSC